MSKLNRTPREFRTTFRMSTVLHPNFDSKNYPKATDYVEVRTIDTRGSWPAVRMIDEDTFVQMAILSGHIQAPKVSKRNYNKLAGAK